MSPTQRYRAGVIGAGAIAQACHLPGYRKDKRAELVAFADPSKSRRREVQREFGNPRTYASYTDMLEREDLDVVSVCTPNAFHAKQAIAALRTGCHVLCEKPMATTLADTDRMMAAAKKARKKLMIGFTHRLFDGPQRCKEALRAKAIGRPFMIRVRFAHGGPYPNWGKSPWFYNKELSSGGALLDMGIHAIDLCHWLIGPIASVSANVGNVVKKIAVDDCAVLLLEFTNGALGYIEVGWSSKPGFSGVEVYGTKGTLICDYLSGLRLLEGEASAGTDSVANWKTLSKTPTRGGWDGEIAYWLDVLEGKERLTMSGRSGKRALQVALAAYQSDKTGRRVSIK